LALNFANLKNVNKMLATAKKPEDIIKFLERKGA
jgi:hypothetical protein